MLSALVLLLVSQEREESLGHYWQHFRKGSHFVLLVTLALWDEFFEKLVITF